MSNKTELSDEEIEHQLAGQSLQGPRRFRGRYLAKHGLNTAGLIAKVLGFSGALEVADVLAQMAEYPELRALLEPRLIEHDFIFLGILADAFCESEKPEAKAATYRGLLIATDDPSGYRVRVAMGIATATEADRTEARRLVSEILEEVEASRVKPVEKKSAGDGPAETILSSATSSSAPSPKKRGGRGKRSPGS
jgi:hypothetical protein